MPGIGKPGTCTLLLRAFSLFVSDQMTYRVEQTTHRGGPWTVFSPFGKHGVVPVEKVWTPTPQHPSSTPTHYMEGLLYVPRAFEKDDASARTQTWPENAGHRAKCPASTGRRAQKHWGWT